MRRRPLAAWAIAAALACARSQPAEAPPPPAAREQAPRRADATVTCTGTLRLKTFAEVRVGAQISGLVRQLNVKVGAHVKRGEVIATIDSRGFEERVMQARAQLRVDEAAIDKLQLQLARLLPLAADQLISRQETEDLEADLSLARARLAKSRADLQVVASDRPYLTIRAPIAGTVASVATQQGETVAASFAAPTFVTIIDDAALELVAVVDETDIGAIAPGEPATFTTETFPARELHGVVERIAPKATVVSGVVNYEVVIGLRDAFAALKPDMTSNVTIQTARPDARGSAEGGR